MSIDRRDFIVGAGVIAAASALAPALSVKSAQAGLPQAGAQAPGFYRTKIGKIEVTSLLDGGMALSQDLLINAKDEDVEKAREDNFLPKGKEFPAYVNGFAINTGKKIILVDTGAKGFAPTLGNLEKNLATSGIAADAVDEIIITHAHPDHTNGLLTDAGTPAFANAVLRIAGAELDFWFSEENSAAMPDKKQMFDLARKNLGPYKEAGMIETFKGNADFGGGVSAVPLFGHTPGHSGVRIASGREELILWGDIVHVPAVQFAHPGVSISFDVDPAAAQETRAKILLQAAADRTLIGGMHLAFPALGHVAINGAGFEFVPLPWETSL